MKYIFETSRFRKLDTTERSEHERRPFRKNERHVILLYRDVRIIPISSPKVEK